MDQFQVFPYICQNRDWPHIFVSRFFKILYNEIQKLISYDNSCSQLCININKFRLQTCLSFHTFIELIGWGHYQYGAGGGNAKLHKGNLRNIPIKVVVGEVKLQGAANVLGRFSSLKDLKSDPKHMPHPVRYTIVNNSTQILFFHFKIHKLNCLYEILLAVLIQNLLWTIMLKNYTKN